MARGPRRRIRRGISKDRLGMTGRVKVRNLGREQRFPFGTPVAEIQAWIEETRRQLETETPKQPRGTLGRDAERYYKSVKDLASFMARRAEIRAWVIALGPGIRRSAITADKVRAVRGKWKTAGVSAKTINNRVFALAHLYRTLDGKRYPTPCDEVEKLSVTKRPAVRIPDETLRNIEAQLRARHALGRFKDAKTRARFMVMAATGRRPSEIGRAEVADVDLERRVWTPRNGKGGLGVGIYLNDDMLEAWKFFAAADAWGWFDSGSFARRLRNAGFPPDFTPYQMRHTVGIAMSEAGIDLKDVGDHLGHKNISTTREHYVPVLSSRMQRASEALNSRRLGWSTGASKDK